MILVNCKVIGVHSADCFTDGLERVTIRIEEADSGQREFRIVNKEGLALGAAFVLACAADYPPPMENNARKVAGRKSDSVHG
jgi:hypothetical protein